MYIHRKTAPNQRTATMFKKAWAATPGLRMAHNRRSMIIELVPPAAGDAATAVRATTLTLVFFNVTP